MKATVFIHIASHQKLSWFIINMHSFSHPQTCTLRHTHVSMHARTHASTNTWCLLPHCLAFVCDIYLWCTLPLGLCNNIHCIGIHSTYKYDELALMAQKPQYPYSSRSLLTVLHYIWLCLYTRVLSAAAGLPFGASVIICMTCTQGIIQCCNTVNTHSADFID